MINDFILGIDFADELVVVGLTKVVHQLCHDWFVTDEIIEVEVVCGEVF